PPEKKAGREGEILNFTPPPKKKNRRPKADRRPPKKQESLRRAPPLLPSSLSAEALGLVALSEDALSSDLLGEGIQLGADLVLQEEAADDPPQIIHSVAPRYPAFAEDRGIEGMVLMRLKISASGELEDLRFIKSEPPGVFDAEAERAVRAWRFKPAFYQGQPVAVLMKQKLVFRLGD
ncbi:energy transducer TonB, partial [Myxococcota bacterium]|nr:energy transducer TonB [Myxococcota bacterium]